MENLVVCIDKTIVALRKVVIVGWVCARDGSNIDIIVNLNCSQRTYTNREDIKQSFENGCNVVGFQIEVKSFRTLNISFESKINQEIISFSCLRLRIKRLREIVSKISGNIKERGLKTTIKIIVYQLQGKHFVEKDCDDYEAWYKQNMASAEALVKQRQETFTYQPLISIVIPTFNTPIQYLQEVIDSIQCQSYANWELILADGCSTDAECARALKELSNPKIKVVFLDQNKMISENTNAAIPYALGEYIGLVDHDDLLTPDALYEMVKKLNEKKYDMIYSDEDKINSTTSHFFQPHFKPDFSIDTLRSYNYITHFTLIRKCLFKQIGMFDKACDGAQDYDMFLRIADVTNNIGHIPKILYHWRVHENSTAQAVSAKTYVLDAGKLALSKHLKRNSIEGIVTDGKFPTSYKINYAVKDKPLVSIVIPNKDHGDDLKRCLDSIIYCTLYSNYEILIVENNSEEAKTFSYYKEIEKLEKVKVLKWEAKFNYSAINNFAVKQAKGSYIVLLNNDVKVLTRTWLEEMLMYAQREDIGAVGVKLYYPNNTIQHAGVIIGIGGVAGHSHKYFARDEDGYMGRLKIVQNVSAVTAACLMVSKTKYEIVNGLDEGYRVAFNDVDFCMKLLEKGYVGLFTPYVEMIHYESLSRGAEDSPEKIERFNSEINYFEKRWGLWREDPYYNPNLSKTQENYSLKM